MADAQTLRVKVQQRVLHGARIVPGSGVHYEPTDSARVQQRNNMMHRNEFEQDRIKVLQQERLHIQKKTFTKWMNSFLHKAKMEVEDLFVDLADGQKLLKLLEIISGEKLAKPNFGRMRVHKIENVNKSLAFLHTKVRLESIGAEDIVDGNPRLILGLIWTIILRFQIQEIEIDVDEENESSEKKSAKDALLLWAQRKTHGYQGVQITNFTDSWRSGLGFNALIHSHRPDLFNYDDRLPAAGRNIENLNHAFDVANNELGIPPLLDAEDIDTTRPDEKSIMTYVASYYHTFARMKNEEKSGRRIAKILRQMMEADKMKQQYDRLTTTLLAWINTKIVSLESRDFPNSLNGIQELLLQFGYYRNQEKPPKYKERSEIEALYFNISTQLKELRQPAFTPPDGKLVQDLERAWERLERSEHSREVALRSELRRQERLEQINYKFERKSKLRESYLKEMKSVLSDPRYGSNLAQVDATVKKHEAISADIMAREARIYDLTSMCEELVRENYRNSEQVQKREEEIISNWKELLAMLDKHKQNLTRMGNVMSNLREIDTTLATIEQLYQNVQSTETGAHLLGVEELLQKHALQELQVSALSETVKKLHRMAEQNAAQNPKERPLLEAKIVEMENAYGTLKDCSDQRKALLEEARNFYQFMQDQEDEEAWLQDMQRICQSGIAAKDLLGLLRLQQKHKALLDEVKGRRNKFEQLAASGQQLINEQHPRSAEINEQIEGNRKRWNDLERLAADRTRQLQDAAETYQFYADANEVDSWLHEKSAILASVDHGSDEPSAQALLQRHKDLQSELNAYSGDLDSINAQAERLKAAGISHMEDSGPDEMESVEEIVYESKLVPVEVFEEEPFERIEYVTVMEERIVPQVKSLYKYKDTDHSISMAKNETMVLLSKSNNDWWCVRKTDGSSGFVPANYVQEIESLTLQFEKKNPQKIPDTRRVKKVKMEKQRVPVKRMVKKPVKKPAEESASVAKRQEHINNTYDHCQDLAAKRQALLEEAIRLFGFYRECDDFERWIKDKEKLLSTDDAEPQDNVEQARRKHEKFVTDLSASAKRMERIDADVQEFEKQKPAQIAKVRARHRQIRSAWNRLNDLKARRERSIAGASSVELFFRTCNETVDWMQEKAEQLDADVLGQDLKTVQALQRRHEQLERELAPVEEKVNRVNHLADSVISQYPHEKPNVAARQKEIGALWRELGDKAAARRARLQNAVGQQIFSNSTKGILNWADDVKNQLNAETTVRDVQTAELLLKNHGDLKQDIRAHQDEFQQIMDLGKKLLADNPDLTNVKESVQKLSSDQEALNRVWADKQKWLEQCLALQKFNKSADKIDATTSGHQAFLDIQDLGNTLDDVEAHLKQHRAFVNTMEAQDEKLHEFGKTADALISAGHYDSQNIDDRRHQVLQKRAAVRDAAAVRGQNLDASKCYQEFCAAGNDLRAWLNEKLKTASDESYRDLSNLERKLQKHEAFECERRANEGQLRNVNKLGQALIAQNSYRKDDVSHMLKDLNQLWDELTGLSLDKGRRLRQAMTQHNYNTGCDEVNNRLSDIEKDLDSENVGTDLRSCRDLLKRHELLENDLGACHNRVGDLVNQSADMTNDDHFNSDAIHNAALKNRERLLAMQTPISKRRAALEEALEFYMFGFDLDNELQWIKEHMPMASSDTIGNNLHEAQNLHKKHAKLVAEIDGHQVVIDKALETGDNLIKGKHPESAKVSELCFNLKVAWKNLKDKCAERTQKLELSLKAQQYFFEANEVESWLNEKANILASKDYGRDRDSATKLLTKHKAIELEIDTYHSIISEMNRGTVQPLVASQHPESTAITERQATLEHLVRSLQRRAAHRQRCLMESLFRHEYFVESAELDRWMNEQEQHVRSEDYGQDYEHLLLLQGKFDDFKHRVEAGSERFRQCENLAQKLISNESPYTQDIEQKQQQIDKEQMEAREEVEFLHGKMRTKYDNLWKMIGNREDRLHAAGEIHRFHRDVSDALSRIHEKSAALGTDLGRDLNSALALLRRHEAFENELVVLEAQLQVLVDDSYRLGVAYPTNKPKLIQKQELVVNAWKGLQERTDLRKDQLQASVDLQKFLSQVRDLTSWASGLRASMNAEENIRSAARAEVLRDEHEALKSEIEAREDNFQATINMRDAMQQTGHYAADEAAARCEALIQERSKLHQAWEAKHVYLKQLIDLHMFLREAKQIENTSNVQEAALSNTDFGETVDEVKAQVRRHEAFEKLVNAQDERLDTLIVTGDKLIQQKHFESAQITSKIADIQGKRIKIKQMCGRRRLQLEDALLYGEFNRDVADTQNWINDRQKALDSEIAATSASPTSLDDKIKALKKHQAFKAEITANEGRIHEIKNKGDSLVRKRHRAAPDISRRMTDVQTAWAKLLQEVERRGKGLEEAQDILEFNNQLDKIEAWIRDKEVMIQAADTGRDYEHCLELTRKLDDVDSDMRVDDARLRTIGALGDKLMAQKQHAPAVKERRQAFDAKWLALQGDLLAYRERLAGALEVHSFDRDAADTLQRIGEKIVAMELDDVGRDLGAVEALQRKQDALVMELSAVEDKLLGHEHKGAQLAKKYPNSRSNIERQLAELQTRWAELLDAKHKRRNALLDNYTSQKFLTDVKEMALWCGDLTKRMRDNGSSECLNLAEAAAQLELHSERKAEIDGRQPQFVQLLAFGKELLQQKPNDKEIAEGVQKLEDMQDRIVDAWNDHKSDLTREYQLQGFKEQMDQLEAWLHAKEAHMHSNDDLGENPRAVESLLRKHADFESMLQQQLVRVAELEQLQETEPVYSDSPEIERRMASITQRKDRLVEAAQERRRRLNESKELHGFIRRIHDGEAWLAQKIQIASDENYRDPTNLLGKIQKHLTFDAEILANGNRMQAIIKDGQDLIADEHFASDEIKTRIEEFDADWRQLQDISQQKKDRLNEAYQASLYSRSLDEFETWLREVEAQVQSNDYGKDLATVTNLLKKHAALENDVVQHNENADSLNDTVENFVRSGHFLADDLQERSHDAITRYAQLQDPIQTRRDGLESSNMLHQFTRDVADEVQWLLDREAAAGSQELGSTLTGVNSLQKKHQVLETELASREPIVNALMSRGSHLTRGGHKSGPEIEAKSEGLKELFAHIRDLASLRRLRLQDALEAQTYYAEASEAETWIAEKRPVLASAEIGRDEDSAQSLQRKLDALQCEVEAFQGNVNRLGDQADRLVNRKHYDADAIRTKQTQIEAQFSQLQRLMAEREARLAQALSYFGFVREFNDVQEWLTDEMAKTASEDYGTDVEHVELLTQAFETFLVALTNSEPRVKNCVENGRKLVEQQSSHTPEIERHVAELHDMWRDLFELAHARKEALAGAKQVHLFDRNADETIAWIQEKEAALGLEIYGQDLDSIQAQLRNHAAFESELDALKEQVEAVENEACALIETFPDTEEHINVKRDDVFAAFDALRVKSRERRNNLQQTEHLQTYFDDYQELLAFINEMLAKITSPDLPQDVTNCELLIARHKEYRVELESRKAAFTKFFETGRKLIADKHFLAADIDGKVRNLEQRYDQLQITWQNRDNIYSQNLDVQLFKREAATLEHWLQVREGNVRDTKVGETIVQVEDMIRKHDDFEKTINAQEDKFQALHRRTMVEEAFAQQLAQEARSRQADKERRDLERQAILKRQEMQRITDQRRQESQRQSNQINNNQMHHRDNDYGSARTEQRLNGNTLYPPQHHDVPAQPDHHRGPISAAGSAAGSTSSLTKSNSVAQMFGNRIRRPSEVQITRAQSMKVPAGGPVKRTPSFNTRRRSSFRGKSNEDGLPPVEIQGMLERKQVLMSGGKKATSRNWKTMYSVLCGQLLCFFKNRDDFAASKAICSPINIFNAQCAVADDYSKRKHTFRVITGDLSEFLFCTNTEAELQDWITKIKFRASLPPSQQLLHFDIQKPQESEIDLSSQSSRTSSPDVQEASVVMRHDMHFQNGNSQANYGNRYTYSPGDSPPPLPQSQPPIQRRYNTLEATQTDGPVAYGNNQGGAVANRPQSMNNVDQKKSGRHLMDLFRKKPKT